MTEYYSCKKGIIVYPKIEASVNAPMLVRQPVIHKWNAKTEDPWKYQSSTYFSSMCEDCECPTYEMCFTDRINPEFVVVGYCEFWHGVDL